MGYYLNTPENVGKADQILAGQMFNEDTTGFVTAKAEEINKPIQLVDIPDGKALICVVENGFFDAAGYVYNQSELDAFSGPDDWRPKRWLLMDENEVKQASGFNR